MFRFITIFVVGFLLKTNAIMANEELSKIFYNRSKEKGKY